MEDKESEAQPEEVEDIASQVETSVNLEQIQAELEEISRERDQFRSLAQRVQADFINYRRRVEEGRAELQKEANARLILDLLSVMDDFGRALEHIDIDEDQPAWLEGVELIHRKLQKVLDREGVTPIEAMGQDFDPWEQEALLHQETTEHREGEVIGVIQEGYKLHGKVLRPAQVVVSKGVIMPEFKAQETSEIIS